MLNTFLTLSYLVSPTSLRGMVYLNFISQETALEKWREFTQMTELEFKPNSTMQMAFACNHWPKHILPMEILPFF